MKVIEKPLSECVIGREIVSSNLFLFLNF
jgi:hypothetical protein